MNKLVKIAGAFGIAAAATYGAAWMYTGMNALVSQEAETTQNFSDNGLRVLQSTYSAGSSNGEPRYATYSVLLESESQGVVSCHGLRVWPQNNWALQNLDGDIPETLYATSPVFEHVFKRAADAESTTLDLGACLPYETALSQETLDALASHELEFRASDATAQVDVAVNNTYFGFPILNFQSFSNIELATSETQNYTREQRENFSIGGDITRIASNIRVIGDTVRDRRYLSPLSIIFADLETDQRHGFVPEVCENAGFSETLSLIASSNYPSMFYNEDEHSQLLESLTGLKLTHCP
jgi:hypothetical protein